MTTPPADPTPPHDPASQWQEPERWDAHHYDEALHSRRDPGSPALALASWLVIACVALFIIVSHLLPSGAAAPGTPAAPVLTPGGLETMMGRYSVGAGHIVQSLAPPTPPTSPGTPGTPGPSRSAADPSEALLLQYQGMFEETPAGALRAAILTAELESGGAAIERLDRLEARDDFPDELAPTVDALRTLYRGAGPDALTPDERDALRDEQGWFADLALGYALDDDDPARAGALGAARRTAFTFFGVLALAGLGGVLGLALAVMFAVQFARRRIVAAYAPPEPGGSVYIEAFAVFLAGLLGVSLLAAAINSATGADITPVLLWLLLLAAFYPLARGVPWAKHKHAIGWTRGKGVVRESFAGVAAYLAGLPIVALGLLGTLLLSAAISWIRSQMGADQGPPMQHPIIDRLGLGGWTIVSMFLLATVWAPLVEETMFRGALYHHMRGRMGPLVSAVLVGFVFAAVHPQGIAAIPALMSLAVVFALMREWRGSVIAPVVAHALHNATLVTAMVLALG